jgi:cell wall-associated NlpC family hydrolase
LTICAAAVLAPACASSGAVPHPFPVPAASAASPDARPTVRDAITATALSLRGVHYRDGGAEPSKGFDCSGFTQFVFSKNGIRLPRDVHDQFSAGKNVKASAVAPGDLLFFSTEGRGASHVGIALGADEFIHAPSSNGVVRIEHLSAPYWSRRFVGARRVA